MDKSAPAAARKRNPPADTADEEEPKQKRKHVFLRWVSHPTQDTIEEETQIDGLTKGLTSVGKSNPKTQLDYKCERCGFLLRICKTCTPYKVRVTEDRPIHSCSDNQPSYITLKLPDGFSDALRDVLLRYKVTFGKNGGAPSTTIFNCTKETYETMERRKDKMLPKLIQGGTPEDDMTSKGSVDLIIFDGASNVQGAGHILGACYPRSTTIKGGEHGCALFFNDVFSVVKEFRMLKAFNNSLCNVFGGRGTRHVAGQVFAKFSKAENGGRPVGLLRAADLRMAGHAMSLMRTLRLSNVVKQCVVSREITHQQQQTLPF